MKTQVHKYLFFFFWMVFKTPFSKDLNLFKIQEKRPRSHFCWLIPSNFQGFFVVTNIIWGCRWLVGYTIVVSVFQGFDFVYTYARKTTS